MRYVERNNPEENEKQPASGLKIDLIPTVPLVAPPEGPPSKLHGTEPIKQIHPTRG